MAIHMMAHKHNNNARASYTSATQQKQQEEEANKPTMFHDFLGMKAAADDSHAVLSAATKTTTAAAAEASPAASLSIGASSGGGLGPTSTVSDLGSVERQVGNHLEGVPFYGHRNDNFAAEVTNRLAGSKRSNSDSSFMGSARDRHPQIASNSVVNAHLMKILRDGTGGPRRFHDDEMFHGVQPLRQISGSLVAQPPGGSRTDASASRRGQPSSNKELTTMQSQPYCGQYTSFMHQMPAKKFKDVTTGPSIISQSAADEGSRTGKSPGILSSLNASGNIPERSTLGAPPSGSMLKTETTQVLETETYMSPSQQGLTSASKQMTIFYGGQAHVFDDVHPNKADVIMSLAGSDGGSWSINYSQLSSRKPNGDNRIGTSNNMLHTGELGGRLLLAGNSSTRIGSSDQVLASSEGHSGSIIAKDPRNPLQPLGRGQDARTSDAAN